MHPAQAALSDTYLHGGGLSGQAGAFRLGISRALVAISEDDRPGLRGAGLLTRDPRVEGAEVVPRLETAMDPPRDE